MSSSRNKNKTINYGRSELKLENSQEVNNYFTLVSGKKSQMSRTKVLDFSNDCDMTTQKTNKNMIRTKKYFNERLNSTASIYKKSSLNIAHFLSSYATNTSQGRVVNKRRKSGRSTTTSNYKSASKKTNERSRSNKGHENIEKVNCIFMLY